MEKRGFICATSMGKGYFIGIQEGTTMEIYTRVQRAKQI